MRKFKSVSPPVNNIRIRKFRKIIIEYLAMIVLALKANKGKSVNGF